MDMQTLVVKQSHEGDEVLSMAEAGQRLGIGAKAFRAVLARFPEIKQQYTFKTFHTCIVSREARKMTVITKNGLVVLANMKDTFRGNKEKPSNKVFSNESVPKKNIAEVAIAKQSTNSAILQAIQSLSSEVAALRQHQALPAPQIDVKAALNEAVDDLSRTPITKEQKKMLEDLALAATFRKLTIKKGDKYDPYIFSVNIKGIRKYLNDYIGRKTIKNYTHLDYIKAYRWLKKLV